MMIIINIFILLIYLYYWINFDFWVYGFSNNLRNDYWIFIVIMKILCIRG